MKQAHVVVVQGNLVCSISSVAEPHGLHEPGTPLEVGSMLAENFARTGSIDGRYCLMDGVAARSFAVNCLRFSQALIERRLARVACLPDGVVHYQADEQPIADACD